MSTDNQHDDADQAAMTYAEIVGAFRTAATDEDFERIGRALSTYYASTAAPVPAAERVRLLREALAQSMGALN